MLTIIGNCIFQTETKENCNATETNKRLWIGGLLVNKAHIILNNDTGESLYAVTLDDPSGFVAANAYKYRYFPYDPQDTADY